MAEGYWEKRYREGDTPWDTDEVNGHFPSALREFDIQPCAVLEIGCGTGTNAIWFAQQGFDVTAVDVSEEAIRRAKEKATKAGVCCRFIAACAMKMEIEGAPFGLAYDFGCLHVYHTPWERSAIAAGVARHLSDDGLWLSVLGSADGPPREGGPARQTAQAIVTAVEPHFEILELRAVRLDPASDTSAEAWRCLMRKRRRW